MIHRPHFVDAHGVRTPGPPPALRGRARAILADPNWQFATWSARGQRKAPDHHYRTDGLDTLAALPVRDLADPRGCVLFLWAYSPMTPAAFEVMAAWGFTFKAKAFTWEKLSSTGAKRHFGPGYWTRQQDEICWLGTLGKPSRLSAGVREAITAPVREHSRKPDEIYARIEALVAGPYVELFARTAWPGWHAWGDEVGKFAAPAAA